MGAGEPSRARRVLALATVALALVAGCTSKNDAAAPNTSTANSQPPSGGDDASTAPSTPASSAPTSASATITQKKPGTQKPGNGGSSGGPAANPRPCVAGGHPTTACTGVPGGVTLSALGLNTGGAYHARRPGEVINGRHIAGDLVIEADNVTVTNTLIDGTVINQYDGKTHPFTITDSTVGPASGCHTLPGVGEVNYRATRVLIRNHPDGFRISGSNVTVEDSYVKLCSRSGDHSDGIEDYPAGSNVVIRHNTFDQRSAPDHTAPIFLTKVNNLTVSDNLVAGGTYSIRVYAQGGGPITVRNNRAVNGAWDYGPVDADCGSISWAGNQLVEIDANYVITKVVGNLPC